MPNQNNRPEYYNHCIASALLLGVTFRVDVSAYHYRRVVAVLPAKSYRRSPYFYDERGYKAEGYAAEGALNAMGYRIIRRQLVKRER